MPPSLALNDKPTRESTTKVRTGCTTCKSRRVKCDEAKPQCHRCAIGGRKCEYKSVDASKQRARNVITVYVPPVQAQPVLFAKDRNIDFFHHRLAVDLDGQFGSKFWSELVLQLSHCEAPVKHAVSAIGVLVGDIDSSLRNPGGYVGADPQAQEQWNKAVRSLAARIEEQPNSNLVPLVCCLLFTCIEFLRGEVLASLMHIHSGFNILATVEQKCSGSLEHASRFCSSELKAIREHIVPMFLRLNMITTLAGQPNSTVRMIQAKEDHVPHTDLVDCRRRLFEISNSCIAFVGRFQGDARQDECQTHISMDDLIEQAHLQRQIATWHAHFEALLERLQSAGTPAPQATISLLIVHYLTIHIWLSICLSPSECQADDHTSHFASLIHHANLATSTNNTLERNPPMLSFEIKLLGPLYFCALKCRHPSLRRQALEMLRTAPRREGLWNAHYAYHTAKRVMEVEEQVVDERGWPVEGVRVHGLPLPNDESRVVGVGTGELVVPCPVRPGVLEVKFWMKPWGLHGGWDVRTEYVEV